MRNRDRVQFHQGVAAVEQDVPAAILTLTVTAVLGTLPAATRPDTKFATALIVIVLTTITAGLFFLLLGRFSWADWCVFCPIR